MATNNGGQSPADIAGIISSVAVAVVLTVVGIYSKLAGMGARKAVKAEDKRIEGLTSKADYRSLEVLAALFGDCQSKVNELEAQMLADGAVYQRDLQVAIENAERTQKENEARLSAQANYISELRAELDTMRSQK